MHILRIGGSEAPARSSNALAYGYDSSPRKSGFGPIKANAFVAVREKQTLKMGREPAAAAAQGASAYGRTLALCERSITVEEVAEWRGVVGRARPTVEPQAARLADPSVVFKTN